MAKLFELDARKRVARHRDIVIPKIIEWRKPFAKELAAKAKSQPNPKEWFDAEFKKAAIAYRSGLLKQYKCQPFWTAIAPPLTLIPTLILTSLSIRSICVLPNSPFLFERFLSDVPLAFPDATGVFPIAVGLLGLTSLELGKKFARERAGELKEKEWVKRHVEKHPVDQGPKKGAVQMLVQTDKGWQVQTTQAPKTAKRPAQKDSVVENISKTPTVSDPMMSRLSTVAEQVGRAGTILMIGISMWSPGVSFAPGLCKAPD
ncbi:hypothetical protein FRB99_002452 [Tulasnella sp. 403]|nr:hypothetical protein FRB99_002452 [Tulasnella sp. 403]